MIYQIESSGRKYDEKRTLYLNEKGIRVVRFWSNDVLQQTDSVLQALWQEVHLPSPQPLSQRERGLEEPSLLNEEGK
jgi:very-short-patch-repair endonuclease